MNDRTLRTNAGSAPRRRPAGRRGLGLVELMIALSITAALLTAVSVATVTSANVVRDTETFNAAAQTARVSLNLILADVRRGQPDPSSCTTSQVRVLTAENVDKTYLYDASKKLILMINNDVLGDTGRVVARNVAAAAFDAESSGSPMATRKVTVDLRIEVGKNSIRLNGSAAPRQNATY
jgi:type II secretory pathway pseudopilin PulG